MPMRRKTFRADSRFVFVRSNFRYLYNFMRYHGVAGEVDGLLADLGVSSHHFDWPRIAGSLSVSTERWIWGWIHGLDKLRRILLIHIRKNSWQTCSIFTENWKWHASWPPSWCAAAEIKKIETIADFLEVIKPFTGKDKEKKFLAQVFQALRIEVNDEMRALREMLQQTLQVLKPGGRLVVITYLFGRQVGEELPEDG